MRVLCAALVLLGSSVAAQPLVVTAPVTAWQVEWDAPIGGFPVERYELRYRPTDEWASVGLPEGNRKALPALVDGAYVAQVRACNTAGCSPPSAGLAFSVGMAKAMASPKTTATPRLVPPKGLPRQATTGGTSNLLFSNGWEQQSELGCTWSGLVDTRYDLQHQAVPSPRSWDDFGPANVCEAGSAQIVSNTQTVGGVASPVQSGQRALYVASGPLRVMKAVAPQKDMTIVLYAQPLGDTTVFVVGTDEKPDLVRVQVVGGRWNVNGMAAAVVTPGWTKVTMQLTSAGYTFSLDGGLAAQSSVPLPALSHFRLEATGPILYDDVKFYAGTP